MRFLSCFSGIEAASAAFNPLGWECVGVAEVDKAAARVLAHHFPEVENLGDVLADDFLARVQAIAPDVLIGGPPCQDFSIAGLRAGIHGARGNLTLRWVQIIHAANARFSITENVPGWLSANDGHAFGAFLAALVGHDTDILPPANCGGRWTDAGMVAGPIGRACWRILDAQFHGLAQRRRRVFIVFCFGDRGDPASILLESKSLRRHTSPRREAREGVARPLASSPRGGSGYRNDAERADNLIAASTVAGIPVAFGGNNQSGPIEVSTALNAHGGPAGRLDFESETFIAHALRGEGFDASEDGTGRGTPIAPICFDARQSDVCVYGDRTAPLDTDDFSQGVAFAIQDVRCRDKAQNGLGISDSGLAYTVDVAATQGVAFAQNSRDEVRFQGGGDIVGSLAADPGMKQQTYIAQAFDMRGREGGAQFEGPHDTANMRAASGGSSRSYLVAPIDTLSYKGINQIGEPNASTQETDPTEILRAMRREIGEEAFTEWGLGISDSFQSPEILRCEVHGDGVRCEAESLGGLVDNSLPRAEVGSARAMREMREAGRERRPPPGWEPSEQRREQFAAALSQLPQQGAQAEGFVFNLWEAAEGLGVLQQALHSLQEIWRSELHKISEPRWAVRRLLPVECEKLQGFPVGWTAIPDDKGKPMADGPRYRQLGNSFAVPVIRWIGERILADAARHESVAA